MSTGIRPKKQKVLRSRKGIHFANREDLFLETNSTLPPDGIVGRISNRTGDTGRDSLFSMSGKVETFLTRIETSSHKFGGVIPPNVIVNDGDIDLGSSFVVT